MQTHLTIKNKVHVFEKTIVMGILNVTPDSFSDGGNYLEIDQAIKQVKKLLAEGADIIDIGGESTRPGATKVSAEEELHRILPVITHIRKHIGTNLLLSVDTYKSLVAKEALNAGANIINSLAGFTFDKQLATIVAKENCPIIIYHIKGTPETMQQGDIVYTDVIKEIMTFFEEQIAIGESYGVKQDQFILDPGIGFGKTVEQNSAILKQLSTFKQLNLPILIGVSRKSHIAKLLKEKLSLEELPNPLERLEGSLAETAIAVTNGASLVRTHDVLQTKKFLAVYEHLQQL